MSTKKIQKLCVANRAEIACRIFQAAKELGIQTVALRAPNDETARHLTFADEIIDVSSYLNADEIVEKTKARGVTMIHPGYGFLSERAHFADAVEKAGIQFLGPRGETMNALGDKIKAKELAAKVGVPTLPWAKVSTGTSSGDAVSSQLNVELKGIAQKMGFPVLIKAAAGGGGKGMRKVYKEEDLLSSAEGSSREALSSFGDGTLFIEKLIERPRHIEVQVFGDGKGGAVHFFERECTLQRRHQKVWEEACSPNLSDKTKKQLFDSAIKLCQHTKYRSAGTLEFLVDGDECYFLEMNTRLQVEHPVTELVNGIDLVHLQIRLALEDFNCIDLPKPLTRGHAIEVRIYAEDPNRGYIPTPGKIEFLKWPSGPGIRIDSGIEVGQSITTHFDPMIAKLVVYAEDRRQAIQRLKFAIENTVILGFDGFQTNLNFLLELCNHPNVIEGNVDTHFLDREMKSFDLDPRELEMQIAKFLFDQDLSVGQVPSLKRQSHTEKGTGNAGDLHHPNQVQWINPWGFFK